MDADIKQQCWEVFKTFGAKALNKTHYDLADETDIDLDDWRDFLNEPDVVDWANIELEIARRTELNKLLSTIGTSRSVGQAQALGTLARIAENDKSATGPAFIYCYVPLNDEQKHADNVLLLQKDIFEKGE